MIREVKKYDRKHGIHHPLLAVDVENNPKDGAFICAGIFGDVRGKMTDKIIDGKRVQKYAAERVNKYITDIAEFHSFLLSLKKNSCLLVFFNLSYDKVFLDGIIAPPEVGRDGEVKPSVLTVGTRVIMVKLKNGIKCLDLTNHVDGSLEKWIQYLEMEKQFGIKKESLNDLHKRVMSDAEATYRLGAFIEDFYYYECGIPLQLTVGAAALKLFTMKFFSDYWRRESDFYSEYERRAYYGGRTELFRRGLRHTFSYDVNSMYLSIMRDCLIPDVSTAKYVSFGKGYRRYLEKYSGIFHVRVKSPENIYIGILPVRIDGKLKFPVGEFSGYWCSPELREAERRGYKILECYSFIYYRKSKPYFRDYAAFVWAKRKEYKAKNNRGMDLLIKKMGNALYGKFAQRNGNEYFGRLADYPSRVPDGAQMFDYRGEIWLVIKSTLEPSKHEFPVIAAFITCYARLKLLSGMTANEANLIYCDTDSLKLLKAASGIEIGKELGQWGFEGESDTEYYRPKFYGEKHKGVPARAKLIETTEKYKKFQFEKPLREREAIKRGLTPNKWVEVIKQLDFEDDKRKWEKLESNPIKFFDAGIDSAKKNGKLE